MQKKRSVNGVSGAVSKVFLNGTKMFVAGNINQVGAGISVGKIASWDGKFLEQNIIKTIFDFQLLLILFSGSNWNALNGNSTLNGVSDWIFAIAVNGSDV